MKSRVKPAGLKSLFVVKKKCPKLVSAGMQDIVIVSVAQPLAQLT